MQSIRQYRHIRKTVAENGGRIYGRSSDVESPSLVESKADSSKPESRFGSTSEDGTKDDTIMVEWEGEDDPLSPRNWSLTYRYWVFMILWVNVFAVDWASSADSQVGDTIASVFGVSEEAETLSPSLYTFGLAAGSVFAGPIAETVGRNPIYVFSRCLHVVWLLGAALAPNFAAQLVFRLFAGFNGSILLAIHAASIADIFGPLERTIAWPLIALASFWGTAFSPIVGAWIEQSSLSWRWTEWIALILSGSTLFLTLFFLPETFSPILLQWKAANLRRVTGNNAYKSELDLQETLLRRFQTALLRALHMITREPIVALLGGWLVIEYLVVFGFLHGFSYIFEDTYGFSTGIAGTCFVALGFGCALWTSSIPIYYYYYKKKVRALQTDVPDDQLALRMTRASAPGSDLPHPEYRLWSALLAAPAFPISLFWLGWTNFAWISPWSNIGAVALLGFSWAGIYVTVYQYILDVYGIYAGSALAIITCWRYLASGFINLISEPMYEGLGVHWTMTMLGCIAALLMVAPLIFYWYGPRIRRRSAFAGRYRRSVNPRKRTGRAASWT